MATKKQPVDQHKKLLTTAIKKTVNTSTVLPILEDVLLTGKEAIVTDLESVVIIPYEAPGIYACVPGNKFIDVLQMTDSVSATQDKKFAVTFKDGKRVMKLTGEDPANFPKNPSGVTKKVGVFAEKELGYLADALSFVSQDDLRPAMTGIYCEKDIVATDAHRMMWRPIAGLRAKFILPAKGVKILLAIGGSRWDVYVNEGKEVRHVRFERADGVQVITRAIDAKFPNYKVVIPDDKDIKARVVSDCDIMLKELKNAGKFANTSTHQVAFRLGDKVSVSAWDVDFGFGYENELDESEANVAFSDKKKEPIEIAFNGNFLAEIIHKQPKDQPLTIKVFGSNKAVIINDWFLLMPLMLNN